MLPDPFVPDVTHVCRAGVVPLRRRPARHTSLAGKYRQYSLRIKMFLSLLRSSFPRIISALHRSIGVILNDRSLPQVVRITAGWIVARVTDKEPFGDRTMDQFPSNAMCAVVLPVHVVCSVSALKGCSFPEPAYIGLTCFDPSPEIFRGEALSFSLSETRTRTVFSISPFDIKRACSECLPTDLTGAKHGAPPNGVLGQRVITFGK